jgi:hypothetical protein
MEEYSNNMSADGHYLTYDFNPAAGGAFDTYLEHIN